MYLFPTAAVINYCQLSNLMQHTFIFLLFQRLYIQNEFYRSKIKVLAGLVSPGGSKGRSGPCLSSFENCIPWILGLRASFSFASSNFSLLLPCYQILLFCCQNFLCFPLISTFMITFRVHLNKPG